MAPVFLVIMLSGYAGGALSAALLPAGRWARALTAAGAVVGASGGLLLGLDVLLRGGELALTFPGILSLAGGAALRLDSLGAFFLGVVSLVALPTAVYGVGYAHDPAAPRHGRMTGSMFNAFLLTMSLVPLADNVLTLLAVWEGMSITSYLLVMTEADHPETVRAGNWYLGMTQIGVAFLLGAFLLFSAGGELSFAALRAGAPELSPAMRSAVFLLALVGFGSKAGLVPLHVWLPLAHPAAPSHVSALMSGVMIKMGVYGILRVGLDLLGGGPVWWGGLVLVVGAVSALLGVLYALMEHDLKRLLAYHSVENVGIICIGLGAGFMFQSFGLSALAALAFIGGLYHTVNHACFKALLFLGAGSVLRATGSRNMEELGGLIKRMPRTALFFLVGAAAISALPPLNGFVSEWIVFQALLGGAAIPRAEVAVLMPIAVAMLALTSGLAAACFVKAFGVTFLGIAPVRRGRAGPRGRRSRCRRGWRCSPQSAWPWASERSPWSRPSAPRWPGSPPCRRQPSPSPSACPSTCPGAFGRMSPALLFLGLAALLGLVPLAMRLAGAARALRVSDTWGCGRIAQTPRMQYTATAFAEPLRRVFAEIYRPTEDLAIDFHPRSRYFVQSIAYRAHILPWFERYLYEPVIAWVKVWAARARAIQSGSVHAYLTYIVAALVALLGLLLARGV